MLVHTFLFLIWNLRQLRRNELRVDGSNPFGVSQFLFFLRTIAAYLCYSVMLTGWVYPIVAHAVWNANGFLSAHSVDPLFGVGMIDFAGSGVVHVTGGITALFATMILGPRRGRFHDDSGRKLDRPKEIQGHSVALQVRAREQQ